MISGCGRSTGAVIPALGSGRYSPGPNIGLPSWRKGSDPNFTITVFWGQPGALATVSKKLRFLKDELHMGHLVFYGQESHMSHEATMRSIELFGKEVMPAIREW